LPRTLAPAHGSVGRFAFYARLAVPPASYVGAGGKLTPLCRLKAHLCEDVGGGVRGADEPGSIADRSRPGDGVCWNVERWAELRREHFVRGVSIKELARRFGIDRNTVRRALRSDRPPHYERPRRPSKLDPFRGEIHGLLRRDPGLTGVRVRELIEPLGFDGRKTIVDDYLREVRPLFRSVRTYQRTASRPGEICQFDLWRPSAPVPVGDGQVRPAFVVVAAWATRAPAPARSCSPSGLPTCCGGWAAACGRSRFVVACGNPNQPILHSGHDLRELNDEAAQRDVDGMPWPLPFSVLLVLGQSEHSAPSVGGHPAKTFGQHVAL
jgi:hypothetical protein